MKGRYLTEGREQKWEDRVSLERKEDFNVDLPWSLFLEEFIRCFWIYGLVGPDSYRKSDVCSVLHLLWAVIFDLWSFDSFIWGSKSLLNTQKWPSQCSGDVDIITFILINGYLTCPESQPDSASGQGKNPGIPTRHHMLSPPAGHPATTWPCGWDRVDGGCFFSLEGSQ